jgi:hypothetical protein
MVGGRFLRVWPVLAAAGLVAGLTAASASAGDLPAAAQPGGGCTLSQNRAIS